MIPYFEQPRLDVGPLHFSAFGVLWIGAILVARFIIMRRAVRPSFDPVHISQLLGSLTYYTKGGDCARVTGALTLDGNLAVWVSAFLGDAEVVPPRSIGRYSGAELALQELQDRRMGIQYFWIGSPTYESRLGGAA